jgi:hypothetical protein
VIPGQMLHKDKGHARITVGGHGGEERFERRQTPGGSADADDGEISALSLGWLVDQLRIG